MFGERFGLIVDREQPWRENHRLSPLLREAKLKSSQACVEGIPYGSGGQLDNSLMVLVLTDAFGNAACRQGQSAACLRAPRLLEELRIAPSDGSFVKQLVTLAKTPSFLTFQTAQVTRPQPLSMTKS